jgi:suppressor for copper-sensitivity B
MKVTTLLRMICSIPAILSVMLLMVLPRPAIAATSAWDINDHVDTRLVSAVEAVGDGATVSLGLHFKLRPGWKIYWRTPGDAGFPPEADWAGSDNLKAAVLSWPTPSRFSIFGLETLGYENEVLLPLTVTLMRPGEALRLNASIRYLACKDICIPYTAALAFELPPGLAAPGPDAGVIARFAALVPGTDGSLSIERTTLLTGGPDPVVQIEARSTRRFVNPDLFVEFAKAPNEIVFGKPKVRLSDGGTRAVIEVRGIGADPDAVNGAALIFTLVDGGRAIETTMPVRFGGPIEIVPDAAAALSIWYFLLLALLGGLILNLMPCVLPVLSIKLLGVVSHGGGDAGVVRRSFLATAAGVVCSMLVIAVALIGVKAAGLSIGWGIQFQQPVFLAFMAVIVTLFAFNLFGLFEIILPQRLSKMALGAGDSTSAGGHFLTGAFATLLATPCSAPFLGTAVGFALSRETPEILAVFAALGVGLALPYLAVAAFPAAVIALPRPGQWMVVLRRVLGVLLLATTVWLLSVIAAQIDLETAVILAALLAVAGGVLALKRLPGSRLGQRAGFVVAALALAVIVLPGVRTPEFVPTSTQIDARWQPFDPVELRRIVDSGGVVFVDVTADWCITCQVNKKLVLDRGPVAAWLGSGAVVAMRADWTRPNPVIARYLASFGRYGIPFNAVYGPKAPNGIMLPEFLTTDAILDSVARVGDKDARTATR